MDIFDTEIDKSIKDGEHQRQSLTTFVERVIFFTFVMLFMSCLVFIGIALVTSYKPYAGRDYHSAYLSHLFNQFGNAKGLMQKMLQLNICLVHEALSDSFLSTLLPRIACHFTKRTLMIYLTLLASARSLLAHYFVMFATISIFNRLLQFDYLLARQKWMMALCSSSIAPFMAANMDMGNVLLKNKQPAQNSHDIVIDVILQAGSMTEKEVYSYMLALRMLLIQKSILRAIVSMSRIYLFYIIYSYRAILMSNINTHFAQSNSQTTLFATSSQTWMEGELSECFLLLVVLQIYLCQWTLFISFGWLILDILKRLYALLISRLFSAK